LLLEELWQVLKASTEDDCRRRPVELLSFPQAAKAPRTYVRFVED